jgi:hypothetical protein
METTGRMEMKNYSEEYFHRLLTESTGPTLDDLQAIRAEILAVFRQEPDAYAWYARWLKQTHLMAKE